MPEMGVSFAFGLQRQTHSVNLCTHPCPVEISHSIDDISRGQMKGVCVGMYDGDCNAQCNLTRQCYPGSQHRKQKEAEQASQAALESVARLNASRAVGCRRLGRQEQLGRRGNSGLSLNGLLLRSLGEVANRGVG
jgi:hypothetical protein